MASPLLNPVTDSHLVKWNYPQRTLLISTLLYSAFEPLQGTSTSADQLMANSVWLLEDSILHSAWPDRKSKIAAVCDDDGVEGAEFALLRRLSFQLSSRSLHIRARESILNCALPCSTGPVPHDSSEKFQVFWNQWMRFLTLVLT